MSSAIGSSADRCPVSPGAVSAVAAAAEGPGEGAIPRDSVGVAVRMIPKAGSADVADAVGGENPNGEVAAVPASSVTGTGRNGVTVASHGAAGTAGWIGVGAARGKLHAPNAAAQARAGITVRRQAVRPATRPGRDRSRAAADGRFWLMPNAAALPGWSIPPAALAAALRESTSRLPPCSSRPGAAWLLPDQARPPSRAPAGIIPARTDGGRSGYSVAAASCLCYPKLGARLEDRWLRRLR